LLLLSNITSLYQIKTHEFMTNSNISI